MPPLKVPLKAWPSPRRRRKRSRSRPLSRWRGPNRARPEHQSHGPLGDLQGLRRSSPRSQSFMPSTIRQREMVGETIGQKICNFRPRPGDIVIVQNERSARFPHEHGGFVVIYKDDQFFERTLYQDQWLLGNTYYTHAFIRGDLVVRVGSFDQSFQWCPGNEVEVFMCENKHDWWLVARVEMHPLQPPVHQDVEAPPKYISSHDIYFKPRSGDFIIRALPGIDHLKKWNIFWWYPEMQMQPYDMLLRVGYETSKECKNHNTTKMVVEMYWLYDTMRYWNFVGRDSNKFSSYNNSLNNYAYVVPKAPSDMSRGWQHMQGMMKMKENKSFFRREKPGRQKRVLDQAYDHHLPEEFDHLGLDDYGGRD